MDKVATLVDDYVRRRVRFSPPICLASRRPIRHRFLLPEALEGVLEFCRESTVFFDVKPGYLGAYLNDGLTR